MKVKDLLKILDEITGRRLVINLDDVFSGKNPFVVTKSSNIPGKSVLEIPGLIFGDLDQDIKKIAVTMTLTEGSIELAGRTDVDVIIAHHPIADAANSGGVTLKNYLSLYSISIIEVHEAFHGLHPGLSYLHGHEVYRYDINYGGIPGNIMNVGKTLDKIKTLGDILNRLDKMMNLKVEKKLAEANCRIFNCSDIKDSITAIPGEIILGDVDSKVEHILHIFPHTGFSPRHLEQVKRENPEIDTVLVSISRVNKNSRLVKKAKELNLNFICGNPHSLEIFENGLPLAYAIQHYVPENVEIVLFRERITSTPVKKFGSDAIKNYAEFISNNYLISKDTH